MKLKMSEFTYDTSLLFSSFGLKGCSNIDVLLSGIKVIVFLLAPFLGSLSPLLSVFFVSVFFSPWEK